jgi:hypothetical protein
LEDSGRGLLDILISEFAWITTVPATVPTQRLPNCSRERYWQCNTFGLVDVEQNIEKQTDCLTVSNFGVKSLMN